MTDLSVVPEFRRMEETEEDDEDGCCGLGTCSKLWKSGMNLLGIKLNLMLIAEREPSTSEFATVFASFTLLC